MLMLAKKEIKKMNIIPDKTYWNNMASQYDNHTKKFSKTYERIIQLMQNEISKDSSILDIGTGTGEIPLNICHNVNNIEAIDCSEEMITIALKKATEHNVDNIKFKTFDGVQLPYPDKVFDIVIMSNLLHIIPSPEVMLNEVYRVLKNQGKIILPTYLHGDSLITRCISWILKQKGHPIYTRFNSGSIKEFVENNRFKVTNQIYIRNIMPVSFIVAKKIE
jgi:ubiquinone/menaquinone biosynthesis C-methylase UbiE